ncbi:MAG: hypothetical protein RR555_05410 [Bacteroidales bacterium]
MDTTDRLAYIISNRKRGDNRFIAHKLKITDVWVCYVLKGKGVSEPILKAYEELIMSRKTNNYETVNN